MDVNPIIAYNYWPPTRSIKPPKLGVLFLKIRVLLLQIPLPSHLDSLFQSFLRGGELAWANGSGITNSQGY